MDSIRGINHVINILRRRISPEQRRTGKSSTTDNTTDTNGISSTVLAKLDKSSLQKHIGKRISALDSSDSDYAEKASRILVESILAWRFGDDILQDPDFYMLEKDVRNALSLDGDVKSDLESLLETLRTTPK